MTKHQCLKAFTVCAAVVAALAVYGKVELASPFADGMVLQREMKVPVWGWADAGEKVKVSFAGQSLETTADANGKWRVDLAPMTASKEGRVLSANGVSVKDVLVGEVWFCSGQSNCECPIVGKGPRFRDRQGALVAQMTHKPFVRYCYASNYKLSDEPREKYREPVAWRTFEPENLTAILRPNGQDGFSAMGVYYALDLYSALDIPIGIVGSWWGGTRIEPWTPKEGFELAGVKVMPIEKTRKATPYMAPSKMWNEMVAPFCPMAMRGFIWYQGCSNSQQPEYYTGYMHALYKGWAAKFENPALKLYFVQLTSWGSPSVVPLQEAQAKFAAEEPNAGMAVINDVGNLDDIHPNEKETVGRRLAVLALNRDYGFTDIRADSPVLSDWRVEGDCFVLSFDHGDGLFFYNPDRSAANGFEICGDDGVWHQAEYANAGWYSIWLGNIREGLILGDNLVVRAPGVAHPKKLRYLHSAPWYGSLKNGSGLPVGAFHVDTPSKRGRTDTVLSEGWTADGEKVSVPHCWNLTDACDGKGVPPDWKKGESVDCPSYERKCVSYRRALPNPTKGRRQFIRFEGASIKATVIVNGRNLGTHKGAFTAFAHELTDILKPTGNEIEVKVDNSIDKDIPPFSGDFVIYGGLYRDVHFIETDPVCIDSLTLGADNVVLEPDPKTGDVVARVKVLGGTNEVQRFRFAEPKLWSPETPNIYYLTVKVAQGGSYDAITVPFGFRTMEFKADGFYLNGKKRKMKGVCRHQEKPGKGWALSAQDHWDDFNLIKKMGADAVRFCHYPHSQIEYSICDSLGFLVWAEMPNVDGVTLTDAFRENYRSAAREFVAQMRNHPSIFGWSVYNEIGNSFDEGDRKRTGEMIREFTDYVKSLDPARPTMCATCVFEHDLPGAWQKPWPGINSCTDVLAWNLYPGWYGGEAEMMSHMLDQRRADTPQRTVIGVSEYGSGASVNQHEDPFVRTKPGAKFHPEEYQARCHWANYAQIAARDDLWGSFVWVMFDFAADVRHEGYRDGFNDKGLVEPDHKTVKSAYHFYKTNWSKEPSLHLVGYGLTETTNATMNVMGFSNVGKVKLSVNGKPVGEQEPDAVKTVVFRDVPLAQGKNDILLEARNLKATATWTRK